MTIIDALLSLACSLLAYSVGTLLGIDRLGEKFRDWIFKPRKKE